MNFLRTLFLVSTLLVVNTDILAQHESQDSLVKLDYDALKSRIMEKYPDTSKVKPYIDAYIKKGELAQDNERIARGYYFKIITNPKSKSKKQYYDYIIELTKDLETSNFPTIVYHDKGVKYYNERKFKDALDNYLLAIEHNNGDNKKNLEFVININIASLKSRIGFDEEALSLYQKSWAYASDNDIKSLDANRYFSLLSSLSHSLRKNTLLDSALFYNTKGLKESKLMEAERHYYHFVLNDGVINYYRQDINRAKDSLEKGLKYMVRENKLPNMAVGYFYLGQVMSDLNKTDEAIKYYKKVDTVFQKNKDILPETRESYNYLTNYYKSNGDLQNELVYIEKLITVDSVLNDNYKFLSKKISHKYDVPKLLEEKEIIIDKLNNKNSLYTKYMFWIIIVALLAITFGAFQYYRNIIFSRRFKNLVENKNQTKTNIIPHKAELKIPKDILKHVVGKLEVFEEKHHYLDSKINLNNLAKQFKTNANYLSKIINHSKSKNFSSYLNELRVGYAFNRLKEDLLFRKYTITAIANEVGFKKSESFSKAFYKKFKIYPSFYIKSLENLDNKKS